MWTVAPQIKTIEQPVQLLDRQHDGFVGVIGRRFEAFGFKALEPKEKAVGFPIQNLYLIAEFVEKDKSTGSYTATFISSSSSAARSSMDFRKSTGLG